MKCSFFYKARRGVKRTVGKLAVALLPCWGGEQWESCIMLPQN